MDTHVRKINRDLVIGWLIIVGILFVSYTGEVIKGERTVVYLFVFMIMTAVPAVFCLVLYRRNPGMFRLRYYIVVGYFFMYLFSMMTGSTSMVFSYILPMLSFLVLYHEPSLILYTGLASLVVNLISVGMKFYDGSMTLANSKDGEIQLALLLLCFGGSYVATRLYDDITNENIAYINMVDEKNKEIQKMTLQTIATIANTIDARDEYTQGHSKRVSEYSAIIAEALGMTEEEIQNIRFVALLHDIGKIGVPDSVLNKPGRLTDEEYRLMKRHTLTGSEILKDIDMIPDIDIGAKYHHERYDGKGYPEGLKGEDIPFIARIISVADTYDAMTSNRIYRKHLDEDKVMSELKDGLGSQFDPEVGRVMIGLLEEGRLEPIALDGTEEKEVKNATTILSRVIEENEKTVMENMMFDDLTGVYNRSSGERIMKRVLAKSACCLMLFNIDRFSRINEVDGFVYGDFLVREMVKCISRIREDAVISRFGEDEFAVLFEDVVSDEKAVELAERFYQILGQQAGHNPDLELLSVSIGIVTGMRGQDAYASLIQNVDKALYFVKQQGGGTYYFYHSKTPVNEGRMSSVDLKKFLKRIGSNVSPGEQFFSYPEMEQFYERIREQRESAENRAVLIMFTIMSEDGKKVSIEERDRVMRFLEKSINHLMHSSDAMARYSSSQWIVMLSDVSNDRHQTVADRVMEGFYKMYDRRELVVHYDMKELK